ncbi:MAG: hypothetical protein L6408_00140 [Nanoarchaeota archaeon]|nr:hypothetical protein [Nanoarchaeota archaeon]
MKKKNIYIVLIIIIVLALIIILSQSKTETIPEGESQEPVGEDTEISEEQLSEIDMPNEPAKTQEEILEEEKERARVNEVKQEAIESKDASICDELEKEDDKLSCQSNLITLKAIEEDDLTICNQIIDREREAIFCKDSVIMSQVGRTGDASLCDKMQEESSKQQCKDSINQRQD